MKVSVLQRDLKTGDRLQLEQDASVIRRRRECLTCNPAFSPLTSTSEEIPIMIIKKDGGARTLQPEQGPAGDAQGLRKSATSA